MLRSEFVPHLGRAKIGDIRRKQVVALLDDKAKTAPVQANRLLAVIRKMFNFCVEREILDATPLVKMKNVAKGELRSMFDFKPEKTGTYRVTMLMTGVMGGYKDANGQPKRLRGSVEEVLKQIPADAKEVRVTENLRRMETFVSLGKPSALALTGKGLELKPVTHPNDLVASEEATFEFHLDGKPAADLELELVADGIRYRDGVDAMKLKTDAKGQVKIKFPRAGLFWLNADATDKKTSIAKATERRLGYIATLEVLP